jgi:2,4-dienoyl-CoA reductase-like NADH-dependent reductase (Old Yellow Enzyme family)/thioredoxin reductase
MRKNYDSLFKPFQIGKMIVKNRIGMSAMGTNSGYITGHKSEQEIDYFIERAKGGAGIIFTGCIPLNEVLAEGGHEGLVNNDAFLPQMTSLCDGVHRYGAKMALQLTAGIGRNALGSNMKKAPMSASPNPSFADPSVLCHEMTKEEIKATMDEFKVAARFAMNAGFDAIELHGHAGYLFDQFSSAVWNQRTDEYGGSPENRARFASEAIEAIKSVVGDKLPIIYRIALEHRFPGGREISEGIELMKFLEKAGVDAFNVDVGAYEAMDYVFPPSYIGEGCMTYVCSYAREAVNVPILTAGSLNPDNALELIESGTVDMVNFGRALLADPQLPVKLMANHPEDVRPCLRCNEFCIGRFLNQNTTISCAVNAQVMQEHRFALHPTRSPKKVVIIGAGPAGMEAARVAAIEGHQVSIYDKAEKLGGTMLDIATSDFKYNIRKLAKWFEVQLHKYKVDIHLNTVVTGNEAFLEEADVIIVGTGATPVVPKIPGIDGNNVISVLDFHKNKELLKGDKAIICGGGASGLDSALEITEELKKQVTVIEMQPECGKDMFMINKITLFTRLHQNNVNLVTESKVVSIDETGLTIEKTDGTQEHIAGDTIIHAFGMRPNKTLADAIYTKYPKKTKVVGDSNHLGKIGNAVSDGFNVASTLDMDLYD